MDTPNALSSHSDPTVAQAADEFDTAFTRTMELLRTELAQTGERATIAKALHRGYSMDRAALLAVLGYGRKFVVRIGCPPDDEAALACDTRTKAFLRGLIGEGPRLSVDTLRPSRQVLEALSNEDLAIRDVADPHGTLQQVDDHSKAGWPTCPTTT
jgi:hypothetical protein